MFLHMKKSIIILSLIFISNNFFADDNQFFNVAQNKFGQEQWQDALLNYQKIQNKNSLVWQNIAICLFRQEQYPEALVAVKRALYQASFKQLDTLEQLEKKIDEQLHIQPISDLHYILRKILFFIPLIVLQIIFLILLVQIFLVLIRRWRWNDFTRQEKGFLKKVIIILLLCIGIWYLKILFFSYDKAIVIKPDAIVYAGPDQSFHKIENLQPGIEVQIIEKQREMYHIKMPKHLGWVKIDVLEPIVNYG